MPDPLQSPASGIGAFEAVDMQGRVVPLSDFLGRVLLIVNTASGCGFTPQLEGLEALHQRYKDQGLTVLGFPCNQFGNQEPGTNKDIASFCRMSHGVSFPLMAKTTVNGPDALPLYRWLCTQAPGLLGTQRVKWNFTKFLVGRDGQVRARYAPQTTPASLTLAIEAALREKPDAQQP